MNARRCDVWLVLERNVDCSRQAYVPCYLLRQMDLAKSSSQIQPRPDMPIVEGKGTTIADDIPPTQLFPTRREVSQRNQECLAALSGESVHLPPFADGDAKTKQNKTHYTNFQSLRCSTCFMQWIKARNRSSRSFRSAALRQKGWSSKWVLRWVTLDRIDRWKNVLQEARSVWLTAVAGAR